jgi:regulator of cell morphogenesis and NO signaling
MEKHFGFADATVRDIVVQDYRTADVFKKYGINYCCSGNVLLKEACLSLNVNMVELNKDLETATKTVHIPSTLQFDEWSLDFLVDYILNVHHSYTKKTIPVLTSQLNAFVNSHKKKYPELVKVQEQFNELAEMLTEHLQKEEETIFPYLKQIANTHKRKETYGSLFVRTLSKPLHKVLESEHTHITAMMKELRKLTGQYQFPEEACTNYQVIFHKLKEFDNDLVQHKHLENNILFPKALQIEKELLQL